MKHLFPRRGISFLEQVPHRPVPASLYVALSHAGARSVDALRLDVGDHGPPRQSSSCGSTRARSPATTVTFDSILLKLGASTVTVYGPGNRGFKDKTAIRAGQLLAGITSRRNCDCAFGVHYNRSRGVTHSSDDVRRWNLAECLLPRQKTNTETAEFRANYNRPQVAASAPGSLRSMVLYSLSAVVPQWRKCCGGNAKYAYLATHFLARFFVSGANLVAA